jgi:hypothetical protein
MTFNANDPSDQFFQQIKIYDSMKRRSCTLPRTARKDPAVIFLKKLQFVLLSLFLGEQILKRS